MAISRPEAKTAGAMSATTRYANGGKLTTVANAAGSILYDYDTGCNTNTNLNGGEGPETGSAVLKTSRSENADSTTTNGRFIEQDIRSSTSGSPESEFQVAGNSGTLGNNQAQNKAFRDVVTILKLDKSQARRLYDEITKQNFGFQEILQIGKDMFGK